MKHRRTGKKYSDVKYTSDIDTCPLHVLKNQNITLHTFVLKFQVWSILIQCKQLPPPNDFSFLEEKKNYWLEKKIKSTDFKQWNQQLKLKKKFISIWGQRNEFNGKSFLKKKRLISTGCFQNCVFIKDPLYNNKIVGNAIRHSFKDCLVYWYIIRVSTIIENRHHM